MSIDRRSMLMSLAAGLVAGRTEGFHLGAPRTAPDLSQDRPLLRADRSVDWSAVRDLFPLRRDWVHLANFLFVSHPKPVAQAIDTYRQKLDSDVVWLEVAALSDEEGRPFPVVKEALAEYIGGKPNEICLTSNTTQALAMVYHGLRIRPDQDILTTEHDHYSHHESIRYAATRSGAKVRYVSLYDSASSANANQMVDRLAKAIGPKTRAVGATWVHSSTGVRIPVDAIAAAVAKVNRGRAGADRCLLVVDGVHGFANQDVDVAKLGADFFATSTHKWLFAPRGTGFLWGRADAWPELRPTVPAFDPDAPQTWEAWMNRKELPPTTAASVSPGGFLAFEHVLAIPAAIHLHRTIGRDRIAARIAELNRAFREGAAKIPRLTLHTPRDSSLSGGISCYEIAGLTAKQVTERLATKRIRTNESPYKISLARVSAGIMNSPEDVETGLRAIRALA